MLTSVVPLISIRRVRTCGIDPEVVISGGISVVTKLMSFAGEFSYTISISWTFN